MTNGSLLSALASASDSVRLSLHVLGATVWVGGQLTLAFLVPTLRRFGTEATVAAARQFARLAWPAFVLLVGTGIWNVIAVDPGEQSAAWRATFAAKMGVVGLSALAAWMHGRSTSRAGLAVWGSITGVTALAAMVLGVVISG